MVFRGKPSKACKRCRERRLRCDGQPTCGACIRANAVCSGYPDTAQLRIKDESDSVRRKVLIKKSAATSDAPSHLALSLDVQARQSFFAHFVLGNGLGTSGAFDFLRKFHDPTEAPEFLSLTIDAASLAYLWHQSYSETALLRAREQYTVALKATSKALQSQDMATKEAAVMASLLLDLFEKFTNTERQELVWRSHINGALALVKARGLQEFTDPSSLRTLVRLNTNLIISYVSTDTAVPEDFSIVRTHLSKYIDAEHPKWKLSGLMEPYANLRSDIHRGISPLECLFRAMRLDGEFQALSREMHDKLQYKTLVPTSPSDMVYGTYFDTYLDRHITQTWNVLRLTRIMINEFIIEACPNTAAAHTAFKNIQSLASKICASLPQYVDCAGTVAQLQKTGSPGLSRNFTCFGECVSHLPVQNLACYTLIFPMFVVGNAKNTASPMKFWVKKQLHYMGSHFGIRNAEIVAQILERGKEVSPWTIYSLLGSYAWGA
ncbi:C6 transcription factor protein [Rutstroemia sp. NJR-2017a WRK4]|nr:C6 transcription factor protein [Rutstroemia sp. NJR-2017a WRK4]